MDKQTVCAPKMNSAERNNSSSKNMQAHCSKYAHSEYDDLEKNAAFASTNLSEPSDVVLYRLPDAEINITNVCRTCLATGNVKHIYDIAHDDISISTLLSEHAAVHVEEEDVLPKYICDSCIVDLIHCYQFKKRCLLIQDTLHEIVLYSEAKCSGFYNQSMLQIPLLLYNSAHVTKNKVISSNKEISLTEHFVKLETYKEQETTKESSTSKIPTEEFSANESNSEIQSQNKELEKSFSVSSEESRNNLPPPVVENDVQNKNETVQANTETAPKLSRFKKRCVCEVCGKLYRKFHMHFHMLTHTKEKPHQCVLCGKAFSLKCNLQRHISMHSGEKPYMCDICGKGFTRAENLSMHKQTHSGEKPHLCDICGKGFKQRGNFKSHNCIYACEENGDMIYNHRVKKFQCNLCGKFFISRTSLKHHVLIHGEKSFLCNHCGKGFHVKAGLDNHLKVHTGERPFKCTVCGKAYQQAGGLQIHMLLHSGKRPYSCEICSKAFFQKPHLKQHIRQHTGEKPYKCSYCNKRFTINVSLKTHIRTQHTGETPYRCDLCERKFSDLKGLKRHRRMHTVELNNDKPNVEIL